MIRVDRTAVAAPPSLAAAGVTERDEAIAFYAVEGNAERAFAFAVYKAPDVIAALEQLFHGKCAYCESSYRAMAPADIEHFRPKGGVSIETGTSRRLSKPGYYWLAADWANLLPSCPDCNRARTHEYEDEEIAVGGKANRFPLRDERRRGRRPGEESSVEAGQRLLVHPCEDDPTEHLEFGADGLVRARLTPEGRCPMGEKTIEVLALRRKRLTDERRDRLLEVVERMDEMRPFIEALDAHPRDRRAAAEVEKRLVRLRRMTEARQRYAGMAREFVVAFELSLRDGTYRETIQRLMAEVTSGP